MSHSQTWLRLFGLTTLAFSLPLSATTLVTSSAGDSSSGTLSAAIAAVNDGSSTGPIQIAEGVTPTLTNKAFTQIKVSSPLIIESTTPGSPRTIDVNDVVNGITVSQGTATFSNDVGIAGLNGYLAGETTANFEGPLLGDSGGLFILGAATISNSNADYKLSININSGPPPGSRLNLLSPISPSSQLWIVTEATLQVGTNQSFTKGTLYAVPATIIVDEGYTLTIDELDVSYDSNHFKGDLILEGTGTCAIKQFNMNYPTATLTINGVLGGTGGGLEISNSTSKTTTVTLKSVNTYTGPTVINTPTNSSSAVTNVLVIDTGAQIGNLSDLVSIASRATLQINSNANVYCSTLTNYGTLTGCGTITIENTADSYGDLTPGCSPSAMMLTGNLIMHPGSNFNIYVDPTSSSSLRVLGDVTIDSGVTLNLDSIPGCYAAQTKFVVLTASGGLSGRFSQILLNSKLLSATTSYVNNELIVTIDRPSFANLGLTGNAWAVGKTVDKLINPQNTAICSLMPLLFFASSKEIEEAFNQLQPAFFKGLTIAQENNIVKVRDTLSLRIQQELDGMHCTSLQKEEECCNKVNPFHVWVDGLGDALSQHSTTYADSPQVGYHENTYGIVTGVDYHFARYFYAGALGAYTHSRMKWQENQGSGKVKSGYGGLYFSALGKYLYGNASVIGSWNEFHEHRNILLPRKAYTANNKHGGKQILSHVDTGINLGWKWFTIRPFDSFDYIAQKENGFQEEGAHKLDLSIQKSNAIMLRNELGFNFAGCFCMAKSKWILSPKISWVREVRIKGSHYTAKFVGTDVPFTVTGYFPDRSLVSPGVSLTGSMLDDLLTLSLYYNGEFKGGYSDHSYGGEIRFGF